MSFLRHVALLVSTFCLFFDTSAMAGGPLIWNGANALDLTTSGIISSGMSLKSGAYVEKLVAPTLTGNVTLTLPTSVGTAGYELTTDGAGALSWQAPGNNTVYTQAPLAVTAVGTAGNPQAGHALSSADFPVTTGKIAIWPLTSTSDSSAALSCSSGSAACTLTNNATAVFTGTGIDGGSNGSATLNGTTQYFSSTDTFLNPGSGKAFAYGAWFYSTTWTTGSYRSLMGQWNSNSDRASNITYHPTSGVEWQLASAASGATGDCDVTYVAGFANSTWHFIALAYDGTSTLKGYVDGKLVKTCAQTTNRASTSASFTIGHDGNTAGYFPGNVAHGFMYNPGSATAFTDADMAKLYARRLDHSLNLAAQHQLWTGNWQRADGLVINQLDSSWIVSKDSNRLWYDLSGIAAGAIVDFKMQHTNSSTTSISQGSLDASYTTTPPTTIAHGLGALPGEVEISQQTDIGATGSYSKLNTDSFCSYDATNLYCDWTGLPFTASASNPVHVQAWGTGSMAAVTAASAAQSGIVNTTTQSFAGAKTFTTGIVAASAQILKQYVVGTAYTNGTPTITNAQTGYVVNRGVLVPYQTSDGAWRLRVNFTPTWTSASISAMTLAFSGVTFKNGTNVYQAFSCSEIGSANAIIVQCYGNPNNGNLSVTLSTAQTISGFIISGDVELDSKPTWAD